MLNIDKEYEENVQLYEDIAKRVDINKVLSISQLEILDQLLLSFVNYNWKKTAFIVGKTLEHLQKNNLVNLSIEKDYDALIAQRINYLVHSNKIKANGDVRAIRFSEIKL